jgi:hypothetical protein
MRDASSSPYRAGAGPTTYSISNAAIDPVSGSVPHRSYLCQIRRVDVN